LPPGPLYAVIALLAAVENFFPPVPADTAVALGAFLAGRGVLNPWAVFGLTWTANFASAAAVYALARRYGQEFFRGRLGRRLLSQRTLERIGREYERHGAFGIFLTRLLPVWRGVVPPFAGLTGVPAGKALVPIALASGVYYGALTFLVARVGHDLERVLEVLEGVKFVLGGLAVVLLVWVAFTFWRRRSAS